jgi:hypothetical protein
VPETSFAPPLFSTTTQHSQNTPTTIVGAVARAQTRSVEYDNAGRRLANAPQYLDWLTLAAGFTGIGAVVFEDDQELAKRAAFAATGALTSRNYLDFANRREAALVGAAAMSCIAQAGETVAPVDLSVSSWKEGYAQALANPESELAKEVIRLAPLALSSHRRIWAAQVRTDMLVARKFASPKAPDVSSLLEAYESNLAKSNKEKEQNEETATLLSNVRADLAKNRKAHFAANAALLRFNDLAISLLADPGLNDALVALDAELTKCAAPAS